MVGMFLPLTRGERIVKAPQTSVQRPDRQMFLSKPADCGKYRRDETWHHQSLISFKQSGPHASAVILKEKCCGR
jgi:hypothetical protein